MINRLLNQLATHADDKPAAGGRPRKAATGFAAELSQQLLGAGRTPARDAERDVNSGSIEGALRRHVGDDHAPDASPHEPSLTGLLLDPPPTTEEVVDARSFEEERTSPEVPSLRSASAEAPTVARKVGPPPPMVGGRPSTTMGGAAASTDAVLRERALARFSGDTSTAARTALEQQPPTMTPRARDAARYRANTIPVQAAGRARLIPTREGSGPVVRAVDKPGEPRVERITKPIKPSLLNPERPVRGAAVASPAVGVELKRPDQWATPQIVATVDEAWRPAEEEGQAVKRASEPADNAAAQTPEAPEPVMEAADSAPDGAPAARVSDTFRSYVEGQRAQLASPAETTTSMMRAVVDQVRSLMDGLGLQGQLKLRTDGAEVQVQSDTLGTLAARIGVEHGVVDLTLTGQAAASLTAEIDALKSMLAEAGLTVGAVKTSATGSSDAEGDSRGRGERDGDDAPRSGSAVATPEDGARGSSRGRRRAHHGQVNVSA
jgi:hypothetical protein